MSCETTTPLLAKFIDGECSAEERMAVKDHLAVCQACERRYEELKAVDELAIASIHSEYFGDAATNNILKSIAPRPAARSGMSGALRPAMLLAASALLLLGATAYSLSDPHRETMQRLESQCRAIDARCREWQERYGTAMARSRDLEEKVRLLQGTGAANAAHAAATETPAESAVAASPARHDTADGEPLALSVQARSEPYANVINWSIAELPSDAAGFYIDRTELGGETRALTPQPVLGRYYVDTDVTPDTTYRYDVKLNTADNTVLASRSVSVKSRLNQRISFHAVANADGRLIAFIKVAKFIEDQWVSAAFSVSPGEPIGAPADCEKLRRRVDFRTGMTLTEIELDLEETRLRSVQLPRLDPVTAKPLTDRKGRILYDTLSEPYVIQNDRIIYQDGDGNQHTLWLSQDSAAEHEER